MNITLDSDRLTNLVIGAAVFGANRGREEAGLLKPTVTLAQIKDQYGKPIAYEARMNSKIEWKPIGKGGRTSGVYCLRADFDKFLITREFDFNQK